MIKTIGVINDLHIPFHDEKAVNLVLDAFKKIRIDELIINGDLLDFYNLSMHGPRDPDIETILDHEIESGQLFLRRLRKIFPEIKITYLMGNHSDRLARFIRLHAPGFYNMLRIEKILNLKELGIAFLPYQKPYQIDRHNLFVMHSPPSYSVNLARASLSKKPDATFIYGCSHRIDSAHSTGTRGEIYAAYANGCLVDLSSPVFSYTKNHHNWQHGGSVIMVDNKEFFVNQFLIKNYKLSLNGKIYGA